MRHRNRLAAAGSLLVTAALLPGCLDMDMQTKLSADGSGSTSMKIAFTEGFVKILNELKALDPHQDMLENANELTFTEPTAEERAAMKAAGCELVEFEGVQNETQISSRFKVAWTSIAALSQLDKLEDGDGASGGGPTDGMTLVKNDDGTYTLSMSGPGQDAEEGGDEVEEVPMGGDPGGDGAGEPEEDPEEAMRKAAQAMEIMGKMMGEMSSLKIVIGLDVPGEVVAYQPADLAKQDGSKVTWTIDMAAAMAGGMSGENEGFSVTFKMPDGTSIPESALTKPAAKQTDEPVKDHAADGE